MAYLAVLTADGGVPIFTRSTGDITTKLPFATVGALNGVHLFSRLRDAALKSAVTPDEKIIWKEYHERLVLILITRDEECNDCHLYSLLDNLFAALAMLVGTDLLLKQGEVMRLQKTLVICYPLVDYLLRQMDEDKFIFGDLTLTSDCFLTAQTHTLQDCMNQFLDVADSLYGCLFIKGKIAASSKDWWTLTNQERVLICSYVNCLPKDLSREVVIYLPTSSPKSPNRLVTLNLLRDVEICVLCSSDPPIAVLAEEARKVWMECFDLLKVVSNLHPRNVSTDMDLDKNILSFLLINMDTSQSICSLLSSNTESVNKPKCTPKIELQKQQEALRTLYKIVAGTYFQNQDSTSLSVVGMQNEFSEHSSPNFIGEENLLATEFYVCLENHKCYMINESPHQMYILFNDEIPKYALRSVAHKTLQKLKENGFFPQKC